MALARVAAPSLAAQLRFALRTCPHPGSCTEARPLALAGHNLRAAKQCAAGWVLFCARCGSSARSSAAWLRRPCKGPSSASRKRALAALARGWLLSPQGRLRVEAAEPVPVPVVLAATAYATAGPRVAAGTAARRSCAAVADRASLLRAYGLTEGSFREQVAARLKAKLAASCESANRVAAI